MYRPDRPELYSENEAGQPDFSSILLTMDSNLVRPEDEHVVQKFVCSTQSPAASLIALLTYYGEPDSVSNPKTMEMLMLAGKASDPVFVYITPRPGVIEVLMSSDTFEGLSGHKAFGAGSLLLLSEKLNDVVARTVLDLQNQNRGGVPRLFFFDIGPAAKQEPETEGAAQAKPEA